MFGCMAAGALVGDGAFGVSAMGLRSCACKDESEWGGGARVVCFLLYWDVC